jgi:hypothetical protein
MIQTKKSDSSYNKNEDMIKKNKLYKSFHMHCIIFDLFLTRGELVVKLPCRWRDINLLGECTCCTASLPMA